MYLTFTLFTDILFIKSSMKTLLIFLKASYSGHQMREESMCNMWSCVFPFHNVQNYHGNLGFLSWNIIEKPLKFFEACLWEPLWFKITHSNFVQKYLFERCWDLSFILLHKSYFGMFVIFSLLSNFSGISSACFYISICNLICTFCREHDTLSLRFIKIGLLWPN